MQLFELFGLESIELAASSLTEQHELADDLVGIALLHQLEVLVPATAPAREPLDLATHPDFPGKDLAEGGMDPFVSPMALALSWGLVFATLLTLITIPVSFYLAVETRDWIRSRIRH